MFTKLLPPAAIANWCRMLRHQLSAGLAPAKILTSLATSGPIPLRPVSERLAVKIKAGAPLGEALEADKDIFPELVVPLIHVGDETGHLPEVLTELEDYLLEEDRRRKEFRQQTLTSRIQLFAAIFIVAGLIWILGMISTMTILGLSGAKGAMIFLSLTLGPIVVIWMWSKQLSGTNAGRGRLRALAARLPVFGPCLEALAMTRFALALHLTLNSSLSPAKALRLSLAASGDPVLRNWTEPVVAAIKKGEPLHKALAMCPLPSDFLDMVAMSEEGGTIPEMMKHQARIYGELARDRLKMVSRVASGAIWLLVVGFLVFMIIRIFVSTYLAALNGKI